MNRLKPANTTSFLLVVAIIFIPGLAVLTALGANQLGYCVNAILPGGNSLNANPYVLQVGNDTAQIRVRGTVAQPATITVTSEGNPPIVQTLDTAKLQTFSLAGLDPGTEYAYTVERAESTWQGAFRTLTGTEDTVRIDVLGNSGVSNDAQHAIAAEMKSDDPDVILHTGDVVYPRGALCHYGLRYFGPYKDLLPNTLVVPSIGEIDLKASKGKAFRETFASDPASGLPLYQSFDYGPVRVVVLDSELYERNDQTAIDQQRAWLEETLKTAGGPSWTLIVLHRPPYSSTEGAASAEIRDDLGPVFADYGVDLVLSGHARNYERFQPSDGVTYVVSGGGGADTQGFEGDRTSVAAAETHHFLSIEASPSALDVRVIDAKGAVIDSFAIGK